MVTRFVGVVVHIALLAAIVIAVLVYANDGKAAILGQKSKPAPSNSFELAGSFVGPPHNVVPVQPQFVDPPWVFNWNSIITYELKLTATSSQTAFGHVEFQGMTVSKSGGPAATATRSFKLKPGETKTIVIRFATPTAPPVGNFEDWCVSADVYVEATALQSARTCATHDSGK